MGQLAQACDAGPLAAPCSNGGGSGGQWTSAPAIVSATTDVTFTRLNGDRDEVIEFEGELINDGVAAVVYSLRPNGLTTNQLEQDITADNADAIAAARNTTLNFAYGAAAGAKVQFAGKFYTKSGKFRLMVCDAVQVSSVNAYVGEAANKAVWLDITTDITTLGFHASIAAGIGVGSVIRIRRGVNGATSVVSSGTTPIIRGGLDPSAYEADSNITLTEESLELYDFFQFTSVDDSPCETMSAEGCPDGGVVVIWNNTALNITFAHLAVPPSASNFDFRNSNEANIVVPPKGSITYRRDTSLQSWIEVSGTVNVELSATEETARLNLASTLLKGLQSTDDKAVGSRTGATLTDADITITPNADKCSKYILPAGTLTNNRVLTINNAGTDTDVIQIIIQDISAFTYTMRNATPTVLATKAASPGQAKCYQFYRIGGVWTTNTQWWVD